MQLPDFPPMSAETLEAIGKRNNLPAEEISPSEDVGIFNVGSPGKLWTELGPVSFYQL